MTPQTFIFMGRSGCGKGTQAKLLMEKLRATDPKHGIIYIQTGAELRNYIKGDTYTQRFARQLYEKGQLMPEFLVIYQWVNVLTNKYTGTEHLVFDGTPRKLHEANIIDSVFEMYKAGKPWVIEIQISEEVATKRLMERKRVDDTRGDIKERMSWYETDVVPTVNYFRNNDKYNFVAINGERSVEEIHADIISRINI